MEPITIIAGRRSSRARPRRRRHRPDHPQAVPQAGRAHRLRRVPLLRLGEGGRTGTCRRTRSSSPAGTSAAAPRASTRPWALEDYGFKAVIAPSFADIFYSNCTKIGLLPIVLPEEDVRALMQAGEAEIDLPRPDVAFDGHDVLFDIDAEIKHRLLNGLDDIAMSLEREEDIDRFERERERSGPVTTAL